MAIPWKRVLLFIGTTVALYLLAVWAMCHVRFQGRPLIYRTGDYYNWPGGESWASFHAFDPDARDQVVIIGSSHAYRGYDPFVFTARGHAAYNLGSSAQTPLNTFYLIKEFLDSTNCRLLVLDIYEGVMLNDGLESTSDLTQNQPSDAAALGMAWSMRDLRALNMMALRMLSDRSEPFYSNPSYAGLGFCRHPDSVGTEAPAPKVDQRPFIARQSQFFAECIRLCRERGIPVVVASHYARRNRRGIAHTKLTQLVDSTLQGTGIPYLDFTEMPGIDDRNWFADHNHLNAAGARIFTEQLVDTLESLGYLPRLRGTPASAP